MVVFLIRIFLFFILIFFLSFHFLPRFISFFLFFFFSFFSSTQVSSPPSFIFFFTSRTFQHLTFASHHRERERERERERGLGLHRISSISTATHHPPHYQARSNRLGFFFFSYLLVLIQLYFKNWILFCVLCFVFGLIILLMNKSLFSLFSFFFFFNFSDFIWFM